MTRAESSMSGQNLTIQSIDARPGVFKFRHAAMGFLLGVFVFPSYFGIDIGFDLTVLRLFEIVLLFMIYKNKIRWNQFLSLIKDCKQTPFILLYMFIVTYTNLYRGLVINGIMYTLFNWVLLFYLLYYLIKHVYGVTRFIKILKKLLWFVCLISILEPVVGFPPFSLLDTLNKSTETFRFGVVRIMGNCTATNGFGLYLMLLLPIAAYDENRKCIDIPKNKWLVLLITACGLLTGGRLAAGSAILELGLLLLFSPKGVRRKTALYGTLIGMAILCISLLLQDIDFFKSLLITFFSAVDEVLGTEISVQYGANATTYYNSAHYRELLAEYTFQADWLNPFLGRGTDYSFGIYVLEERLLIRSTDNYYVGQYIAYAYPGLIAWLLMAVSFLPQMIVKFRKRISPVGVAVLIAFVGYFVSLWYLDQLQTFPIMMALFALSCCNESAKVKKEGKE